MFFSQKEKKEKKPTVGIFGMVSVVFIRCLKYVTKEIFHVVLGFLRRWSWG